MAWTQTLALWKSNAAPPCSGPLIANVTCCSLAAVFCPLCLARNAQEAFLDIFTEKSFIRVQMEDAPFQITEGQEPPEWFRADAFLKPDDWTSLLLLWPWLAAVRPGTLKRVVEGWTCSSDFILHYQRSQLSGVPTVDGAVIEGIGTPPAGTRWGGSLHLQFWDAKAQRWAPLCLLHLFAHMVFTLTNTAQRLALVTGLSSSEFDLYYRNKMYISCWLYL